MYGTVASRCVIALLLPLHRAGDLLSDNILILQQPGFDPAAPNLDGPLIFIDYEYGGYTHRYDLDALYVVFVDSRLEYGCKHPSEPHKCLLYQQLLTLLTLHILVAYRPVCRSCCCSFGLSCTAASCQTRQITVASICCIFCVPAVVQCPGDLM